MLGAGNLMPTNGLTFDAMRVPAAQLLGQEGQAFMVAMNAMDFGRLTVAARSLGLSRACLDASITYADQRMAFGKKIGHFQMIKKQLADMVCEVEAVRAPKQTRKSPPCTTTARDRESSIAKYFAGEVCDRRCPGDDRDLRRLRVLLKPADLIYLNYAKLWQTGEGSANIQAILIADDALGWKPMHRHRRAIAGA